MEDERAVHSSVFFSEGIFSCFAAYPGNTIALR